MIIRQRDARNDDASRQLEEMPLFYLLRVAEHLVDEGNPCPRTGEFGSDGNSEMMRLRWRSFKTMT